MQTIRHFAVLLFLLFLLGTGRSFAQNCISLDGGPDDTICSNACVSLNANTIGSNATTSYLASPIPYQPYPFGGANAVLVNMDDAWSPAITIPFCFEFYGSVYSQLVIGTNGLVTFDASLANGICPWTINTAAPNIALPLNCIMSPYHDLDPTIVTDSALTRISWDIYGTAPCRALVISWYDLAMYGNGCDTLISTSQVVLHESTNIIDIFIREKNTCTSWNNGAAIEGLHNANGTLATIVPGRNYPAPWTASNDGVRFFPNGGPGFSVQWLDANGNPVGSGPSVQDCPTQSTSYTVQMINVDCAGNTTILSDTVHVTVIPTSLSVSYTSTTPSCAGGCNGDITIQVTSGTPPFTYTWSPPVSTGPTATGLCPGTYGCTINDASGCPIPINVNLTPVPTFTVSTSSTPTSCSGNTGTANVTVSGTTGPYTFLWSTGDTTTSLTGLGPGTYVVDVTDSLGCTISQIVQITTAGFPVTTQIVQPQCAGMCSGSISIVPAGGIPPYTYNWTPSVSNNGSATGLCNGNYLCTITDSAGCSAVQFIGISSPPPILVVPSSNVTICEGQSTTISALVTGGNPPYTYNWNNSLPPVATHTITPTQTTVYTVSVTDSSGCTSPPQSTMVKINPVPKPDFVASPGYCPPAVIQFTNLTDTATGYFWNFGDPLSGTADTSSAAFPTHIYNTGGTYDVTLIATNNYGCSDTITLPASVIIPPAPDAGLSVNTQIMTDFDPPLVFNNTSVNGISYLIFFGDGDSLYTTSQGPYYHQYDSVGTYTVMLIAWAANGCTDTTRLTFEVVEAPSCFVPNAFTPNGTGLNDIFYVYGVNISEFQLMIFNRWGELIFLSRDMSKGWDGRYQGEKCQEDVYVWKLNYMDIYGHYHEQIGHVSLIR